MSSRRNFLKNSGMAAAGLGLSPLFTKELTAITNSLNLTQPAQPAQMEQADFSGPEDAPNRPFGTPQGIFPGRVVWAWNPEATNANCTNAHDTQDFWFKPENTNKEVVREMLRSTLPVLTGESTVKDSWNALFKFFNKNKHNTNAGYVKGEKIFVKINQGTARWLLTDEDKANGYYYPQNIVPSQARQAESYGTTETNPYVLLEVLKQLVYDCGIDQENISVGDPMTNIYGHLFEVVYTEFPKIKYVDKFSDSHNRTLTKATEKDYLLYSNKQISDPLFDVFMEANYLINIVNLKPHVSASISLTAKNHFGSNARGTAMHLHPYLISPRLEGSNGGYRKYRVFVDLMGSKYLGRNTVISIVDGLFGGGSSETRVPVKYFMPPFNNNWCNSIFVSLDQVALDSVGFDFLRAEWNGIHTHNPMNNRFENRPNIRGVDDYIHQAADRSNWPEGIIYDPDGNGTPIPSLGVHEHWNNPIDKQYSVNMGTGKGIELVSIPESLVKTVKRS